MTEQEPDNVSERERLIFGAGFAFGALTIMLILGLLMATVVPNYVTLGTLLDIRVLLTLVIAIGSAFTIGIGLYVLGIPESGIGIPRRVGFETDPPETDPDFEQ